MARLTQPTTYDDADGGASAVADSDGDQQHVPPGPFIGMFPLALKTITSMLTLALKAIIGMLILALMAISGVFIRALAAIRHAHPCRRK